MFGYLVNHVVELLGFFVGQNLLLCKSPGLHRLQVVAVLVDLAFEVENVFQSLRVCRFLLGYKFSVTLRTNV